MLNFNKHIDDLCKKLTQRIAVFKKNQASFTFRSTNSLLQCHDKTNCMALVCGFLHLLIIFRLQRRTARVILNADSRANSVDLFRELN